MMEGKCLELRPGDVVCVAGDCTGLCPGPVDGEIASNCSLNC